MLTGHNSLEGGFFFNPLVKAEPEFKQWIVSAVPGINASATNYLAEQLIRPFLISHLAMLIKIPVKWPFLAL